MLNKMNDTMNAIFYIIVIAFSCLMLTIGGLAIASSMSNIFAGLLK